MAILDRLRGARDAIAAARSLRRLRRGAGGPSGEAPVTAAAGPGAPPRPARRRTGDDPATARRLTRWRGRGRPAAAPVPAAMTGAEREAAMRDLAALRERLGGDQAALIDAAVAAGQVGVRRLGPDDGHVWEMAGMRVFAIAGVQAFTVRDEPPTGL